MDHRYIEENNLVERYVLGRLPVEEQIRFEEHFADCEACVSELELADDFGATLRATVADDAHRVVQAGRMALIARWFRGPRAAMFSGLLVLVALLPSLWLMSENRRLAGDIETLGQPRAGIPSFLLTTTRDVDGAAAPLLSVPAGESWLTLAIEVGETSARYDATLFDAEGGVLWSDRTLEPNLWSVLQMTFPVRLLPAGEYRLELVGRDAAGIEEAVDTYRFRIAPP